MPILTDEEITELKRKLAGGYQLLSRHDLSPLKTRVELFAYIIAWARQEKIDEVEAIDAFLKLATPWREDAREVEKTLRQLGYTAVCDYLKKTTRYLSSKPPRRPDLPDHSQRLRRDKEKEISSSN